MLHEFDGKRVVIKLDPKNPKDNARLLAKKYANKSLSVSDKAKLFDAFVAAGIIRL